MRNIQSELARIDSSNNKLEKLIDKRTALKQMDKSYQKDITSPGSVMINSYQDAQLRCAIESFKQEFDRIKNHVLPRCEPAQQWLITDILGRWNVVAHWHFYSDAERHIFYPFNLPQVRKWCKETQNELFLKKEVANFSLCLLIPSAGCRGPNGYDRYGQLITEQLQFEVKRALMPLDPAAPTPKQMAIQVLQWLQDYEAWLTNGYVAGQPDTLTISGQMLWDVIPLAERDKKLSYLKFWFVAQRAYWRFLKAGNGVINVQANGDKLLRNWRNQLIVWT